MVTFRKMTQEEFLRFKEKDVQDYALTLTRGRGLDETAALRQAEREFDEMLPDGLLAKDQFLCFVLDARTGKPVGEIWYGYETDRGVRQVFLADLLIYEAERRRGYATAALYEMERAAGADGCAASALYVWDHNPGGLALYEKCGYAVVSRTEGGALMKKKL